MNGSGKAGHKNILPSAVVKMCGDVLNQQREAKRNMGGNHGNYGNQNNNNKFQQQQQQQQHFGGGMPQQATCRGILSK